MFGFNLKFYLLQVCVIYMYVQSAMSFNLFGSSMIFNSAKLFLSDLVSQACKCDDTGCHCCVAIPKENEEPKLCLHYIFSKDTEATEMIISYRDEVLDRKNFQRWSDVTPICLQGMGLNGCLDTHSIKRTVNNKVNVCLDVLLSKSSEEIFRLPMGCIDAKGVN